MTTKKGKTRTRKRNMRVHGLPVEIYPTRERWLEVRKTGISATDMAGILGYNPYRLALDVYLDKLDLSEPVATSDRMRTGLLLETPIAQMYAEDHGVELIDPTPWCNVVHPDYPFLRATPDRFLATTINGKKWGLEIKTAGFRQRDKWGESGTDEVPDQYFFQVHHTLLVTGFDGWDVALLLDNEPYYYRIERDEAICKILLERGISFWQDNIVAQVPPVPGKSGRDKEALKVLYPKHEDEDLLEPTDEIAKAAEELLILKAKSKNLAEELLKRENAIKGYIGNHAGIRGQSGWRITWKAAKDKMVEQIDIEASMYDILGDLFSRINGRKPNKLELEHFAAPYLDRNTATIFKHGSRSFRTYEPKAS